MKTKKKNKASLSDTIRILARIVKYTPKYTPLLIISFLLSIVSSVGTILIPKFIGDGIDICIDIGKVDFEALIGILVSIGICAVIIGISTLLQTLCSNRITFGIVNKMRTDAFSKLQALPVSYVDAHGTGETVSRIISDTEQFTDGMLMVFSQFLTGLFTIIGTLVLMISMDYFIAIIVVVMTPISLIVAGFIASRSHNLFEKQAKARAEPTAFTEEMISNHNVVTAFSHEKKAIEDFEVLNRRLEDVSKKATFISSLTNPSTRFINNIMYASVALVGAILCIKFGDTRLTVGALSTLLGYATQYAKPFNEISGVVTELQNSIACAKRVFELIDEKPETDTEKATLQNVRGDVEFKNVSFSYKKDRRLIENLNLNIKSGSRVAIVGPTGCGKTTLINLLMRFYDVDEGDILIDGTPITSVDRKSLRENWGMVLQDTWLSEGSVFDNIAFGKPDATREQVIAAAKASNAHSFIKRLPNGYDTILGENGGSLSAGQKQLLCITRVMLSLPPMLILDEATSSIDTRTEQKIQKAFALMMSGRTSFIVAHRLSTIKDADLILVMNEGKVIESGSHDELIDKKGFYHKLYNSQFEGA